MARLGIVERLYCEIHITVKPMHVAVMNDEAFRGAYSDEKWKFSKFDHDDVDGIEGMWFLSSKEDTLDEAMHSMDVKVKQLMQAGFTVTRAKIEDTQFDTKYGDSLEYPKWVMDVTKELYGVGITVDHAESGSFEG